MPSRVPDLPAPFVASLRQLDAARRKLDRLRCSGPPSSPLHDRLGGFLSATAEALAFALVALGRDVGPPVVDAAGGSPYALPYRLLSVVRARLKAVALATKNDRALAESIGARAGWMVGAVAALVDAAGDARASPAPRPNARVCRAL